VLIGWNSDSTSGLVDLNAGGTINTTRIYTGSDNGTHPALSVFNFNGGTLKSTASDTTADPFINNNGGTVDYQLNVKEGGAIIDIPTGMSDTIAPALLHAGAGTDGGLKKNGGGALTLAATPTYNGDTTVNAGVLNANGGISTPSATVYVATGATLNATSIVADTLTIGGAPHLAATAVPEPGTFVLLVLAGLGAFLARRRK
jgi:autotransporter-associated beta strand protein